MNTHHLKKRYQKSHEEIVKTIQLHLGELADHARYEKGTWHLDDEAVALMDSYMKPSAETPPGKSSEEVCEAEEPPETTIEASEVEVVVSANDENENENTAEAEIAALKQKLKDTEQKAADYANELAVLQEKFLRWQNGKDAMNSSFIKKHQIRAETAEKELKKMQQRFQDDIARKDERIKELESRIDDMQEKLVANHNEIEERQREINALTRKIDDIKEDAAARCSKAELRVLESKRSEDKLYQELHVTENKLNTLTQRLETANEDRSEALRQMAQMKAEFISVKSKLIEITAGLGDYLTTVETITDTKIIAEETVALPESATGDAANNETPPALPENATSLSAIQEHRQELLNQLKKEQEEKETLGFWRQLLSKAASVF